MSLRMSASRHLAALFVVGLAFGSTAASADVDPVIHRPHVRHYHHQHHRVQPTVVEQPVTYVNPCGGCGSYHVAPRPVYVAPEPVYVAPEPVQHVHSCGCGHATFAQPVVQQPYYHGYHTGWRSYRQIARRHFWFQRRHANLW